MKSVDPSATQRSGVHSGSSCTARSSAGLRITSISAKASWMSKRPGSGAASTMGLDSHCSKSRTRTSSEKGRDGPCTTSPSSCVLRIRFGRPRVRSTHPPLPVLGTPCTESCSPSQIPRQGYPLSTGWRASTQAARASIGGCWCQSRSAMIARWLGPTSRKRLA